MGEATKQQERKVVLIACSAKKKEKQCAAEFMYTSDLFRKSLAYALTLGADKIYILSAKYGLLTLDEEIKPYDVSLNTMPIDEVRDWSNMVIAQIKKKEKITKTHFVLFAGSRYRKFITPHLRSYEVPLEGRGIGEQISILKNKLIELHGGDGTSASFVSDEVLVNWLCGFYRVKEKEARKLLRDQGRKNWMEVRASAWGMKVSPVIEKMER